MSDNAKSNPLALVALCAFFVGFMWSFVVAVIGLNCIGSTSIFCDLTVAEKIYYEARCLLSAIGAVISLGFFAVNLK